MGIDRREFIKKAAVPGAALAATGLAGCAGPSAGGPTPDPSGVDTVRNLTVLDNIPAKPDEDEHVRMQRELKKAMAKSVEQRRWVMVIDTRKCIGCHACTIGCVAENKLPPGVVYRPVVTEEAGEYPNLQIGFTPRPCMQCDNPPCVPVCPVNATWKRVDDIVVVDYDKCIGCRYCLTACPYLARTSDFGEHYTDANRGHDAEGASTMGKAAAAWEEAPNFEYAKAWKRDGHTSPKGNARKCHFCLHRLEVGQLPMCVTTCVGRATFFGDANDPDCLAVELITRNRAQTLLPEMGTKPSVYYIV
jgi:Fe-S-cluster-containing dehydrogenase component